MPRENRKRGKKHKKQAEELEQQPYHPPPLPAAQEETGQTPSWILSSSKQTEEINPEAPYGYIDADVKAYFRTVDVQIREWQESRGYREEEEEGGDVDPNEERRLFFVAALKEMQGKEKQMATDPDCSVILERMFYSMDDFVRRVFVDSLAGSYETLVKHRFASHVCQTLFSVARDTVSRETKGIFPSVPDSPDKGELRTLTQLILDVSEELLPTFPSLIMDPFASHVMRSLLLLLSPTLSSSSSSEDDSSAVRSKKSAAWKAKQGPMKSVFSNSNEGKGKSIPLKSAPLEFTEMARRFVQVFRDQLGENEVRAMAASKVAGPGLQVLLEVEADQGMANEPGSLMDRVMVGLITDCQNDPSTMPEASDYLGTLLRDPSSSHILEIITFRCPPSAFDKLWAIYFKGALPRLAVHPVANFVLAKALERVSEGQLLEVCAELRNTWHKLISTSRTGVLRAAIDRAAILQALGEEIVEATYLAFNLESTEGRLLLVPCVLMLLPLQDYKTALASGPTHKKDEQQQQNYHRGRPQPPSQSPLTPKIQGSVLLQSFLRLPEPHNQPVLDSIHSIPIEDRIKIAHDSSASRVYDVLLDSPTVPLKAKRQFVMGFIGHYHLLVDDRIGSRVGDRCWAFADTYLKEKIAKSLISHDQTLAASFYGKFFARNLNLYLLQRRPEEWRNTQSEKKKASLPPPPQVKDVETKIKEETPKKRKRKPENEIDELFDAALGRKIKKAALVTIPVSEEKEGAVVKGEEVKKEEDKSLKAVLGAIRSAPKGEEKHRKKRKKV
ncbi:uncharacterized protein LACBIDRAFT_303745 [Laccaria bicolor S238N-H82]|uniref:Nucleolar protein 9 n=1 Tax=Laccaria bicolor (strain S238N-H82 / ATCC MYA-4686) TaxID=486041 RepID=B0DK79_LACBS|nr:uncharacterized protein LACBIDRAFT_303745 [Laccaria bicolor S238N-H82]EDR04892.1 predicted protein [Laccaria bicolor S238N-H82]|eukprot:XP_001884282.1 predicted protein [Laccaria bicolor S238N-H82]